MRTIGFLHTYQVGDNIMTFPALYALKKIYDCRVVVFGNALMCEMLRYCDFVDERVDIGYLSKDSIPTIDSYHCDVIILTNSRRAFIKNLQATNARLIITPIKLFALFAMRVRTPSLYLLYAYRNLPEWQRHLLLVRCVDSKKYDEKKLSLDFTQAKIRTAKEHREFARACMRDVDMSRAASCGEKGYKILINPFSNACQYTLSQKGWFKLIEQICQNSLFAPIVITYPKVYEKFIQDKAEYEGNTQALSRLVIIKNDEKILNLVALIEQMDCVISTSTGPIHIASNLRIPSIGLYPKFDMVRWGTYSKDYVLIPRPKVSLSPKQEQSIILSTLAKLSTKFRS